MLMIILLDPLDKGENLERYTIIKFFPSKVVSKLSWLV
jgi:hypothetical protein